MELCDKINSDVNTCVQPASLQRRCWATHLPRPSPPCSCRHGKDAAKALRKRLTTGTPKVHMLALTVRLALLSFPLPGPRLVADSPPWVHGTQALEAAVKNCGRRFHELVAQKEALQAVSKLAASRRADPEVREKAASLVQQWADEIRLAPYRDTYSELQSKRVDFPPRDVASMTPVHTPPASVPVQLSDEDAAAIAEAIRQSEAELAEAAAERARVEAATREHVKEAMAGGFDYMNARKAEKKLLHNRPGEYMAVPDGYTAPQNIYSPEAIQSQRPAYWGIQQQPGGAASPLSISPPTGAGGAGPALDGRGQVEMARTTCEVVKEMLGCIDPSRPGELLTDDVITQLAATCRGSLSPALQEVCVASTDEALLADALAVNDEMQRLLEVYDYLFASAKQQARGAPPSASTSPPSASAFSSSPPPVLPPKPARLATASPGSVWAGPAAGAPPEEQRLEMRARARSRGAALLAEAGLKLAPPPASKPRTPMDTAGPSSSAGAGPSRNSADLLAELEVPPSTGPGSVAPFGYSAYSNPSFDPSSFAAPGAGPSSSAMAAGPSVPLALAQESFARMGLTPPPPAAAAAASGADPFAELLPPVMASPSSSAAPPPPPSSMGAMRAAAAGPASMRPPPATEPPGGAPVAGSNPFA